MKLKIDAEQLQRYLCFLGNFYSFLFCRTVFFLYFDLFFWNKKSSFLFYFEFFSETFSLYFGFFSETEEIVSQFLKNDICRRVSDGTLLVVVFVYFMRAGIVDYDPWTFFCFLYEIDQKFFSLLISCWFRFLANDCEEDNEEYKLEILAWVYGSAWRRYFKK